MSESVPQKVNESEYELSIIVAMYNCQATINAVLEALTREYSTQSPAFEVIVVNNNSSDHSPGIVREYVEKYHFIKMVDEASQGLSFTKNRGLEEAHGQYVFFIDANKVPNSGLVEQVVRSYKEVTPEPLSVGGQYLPKYETSLPNWYDSVFDIRSWGKKPRFLEPHEAELGFVGGCCSFNRNVILEYGGFDINLGMNGKKIRGGEETNLYWRIYNDHQGKAGAIFYYNPDISVVAIVPKEKTTLLYRMKRSVGFGISARMASANKRPLWKYIAGLPLPFIETIKEASRVLVKSEFKVSTRAVMLISRFCWYCGYYYANERLS